MNYQKLFLLLALVQFSKGENQYDNINYYQIPQYDGSREKVNAFNLGQSSLMYWPTFIDYDEVNQNRYIVVNQEQTIIKIDKNNERTIVGGRKNIQGYKNGEISSSQFRQPTGLVYYKRNIESMVREENSQKFAIKNGMQQECKLIYTQEQFDICQDRSSSNEIKDFSYLGNFQKISDEKIQQLAAQRTQQYTSQELEEEFIFVSDFGNHCIRRISLTSNKVETYAGNCGNSGTIDGVKGKSLLRFPKYISIDALENIYVLEMEPDFKNTKLRVIDKDKSIQTLQNGACRQIIDPSLYKNVSEYFDVSIKRVLCHKQWIYEQNIITDAEEVCLDFRYACDFKYLSLICKSFINGTETNMANSC